MIPKAADIQNQLGSELVDKKVSEVMSTTV